MNRKRNATNHVQVGRLVSWLILLAIIATWGLSYVYVKNKIHALGEQRTGLERQLKGLQEETGVVRAQIALWSSHQVLSRRLQEGFIRLERIPDDRIVRLRSGAAAPGMDGVRAVVNEMGSR